MQAELARVFGQYIQSALDAAGSAVGGFRNIADRLGVLPTVRASEPHLISNKRFLNHMAGSFILRLGVGRPEREFVLAVEATFGIRLGFAKGSEIAQFLREALAAADIHVVSIGSDDAMDILWGKGSQQVLGLDATVAVPSAQGWARLFCRPDVQLGVPEPPSLAAEAARWERCERLRMIPVDLAIEAGYGFLPVSSVLALQPKDIVILDHFGPRPVTGGPVALRLSGGIFPGFLDGAGVTIMAPFHLRAESMADTKEEEATISTTSGEKAAQTSFPSESLLRDLPVQIVCEIGRVTLSAREILELKPGSVVQVGRPLAGPVDLTAGGRVIARGELVDVEGELGVRLSEITE